MILNWFLQKNKIPKLAFIFILFSTALRMIIAQSIEFGNDEVYYWLYALYTDFSHFDHPPMVGFFIQLFTFNLYFDSELFIRLAAIIPASFNMFLLYKIGVFLKDEYAGLINILLYNISIYGLVISGIFILPDAPLLTFWLLSFFFFLQTLTLAPEKANFVKLFLAFLCTALAIYSKYQAIYLLLGMALYLLIYNKTWLKVKRLYLFLILPFTAIFIIFYWNYQNNFISFSFHNDRVSLFSFNFNKDSFFRELFGQILYNNPYLIVLLIIVINAYLKNRWKFNKKVFRLFIVFTLPLIITTIYLSLFRDTLPHWSGIAYITLIPLIGTYIIDTNKYIKSTIITFCIMFGILLVSPNLINKGWFLPKNHEDEYQLGNQDFTLDMYGWNQAGYKIADFFNKNPSYKNYTIVSNKWFPAAHIQYYIAKPMEKKVYGMGSLKDIHKYYWTNKDMTITSKAIYITDSKNFKSPETLENNLYSKHQLLKKIPIKRNQKVVKNVFLFLLEN